MTNLGMRLTVTTGNLRTIATEKVARMGLIERLDLDIGAYGDDSEDRTRLVPIARQRAGLPGPPWPRTRTVVVGDTPADVAGARVSGVASVVFSSTRYSATALSSAEAVVTQVEQLVATLESWQVLGVPA
jgi:phosphoglycolate phosphatase-like HAD superfamily hydrolase